jgi:hypothetical protein
MEETTFMDVLKTDGGLPDAFARPGDRKAWLSLHPLQEIPATDEFGHEKVAVAEATRIERQNNMRTLQRGDQPNFPEKSRQLSLVAGHFCRHHFDRDNLLRFCVAGLIDDPVFPPPHEGNQRVFSQVKVATTSPQFLSLPRRQPPPESQIAQNIREYRPVGSDFRQQPELFVR